MEEVKMIDDLKEMLNASNESLQKMLDLLLEINRLAYKDLRAGNLNVDLGLSIVIMATIQQNNHLLKCCKQNLTKKKED